MKIHSSTNSATGNPMLDQLVLSTVINNLPGMVFYKNPEGRYLAANEQFCKQLHTTTEEIIGRTDYDFYPSAEADIYRETDLKVLNTGMIFEGFREEIDIEGICRTYETRKVLIRDENGEPAGIIGLAVDITNQKNLERELKELASNNQAIIKALPDLVFLFDQKGDYINCFVSNTQELLFSPDEFIGKNISDFFIPEIAGRTVMAITECLASDAVQTIEYFIGIGDEERYYEARFIKVEEDRVMCLSRNITDRVRLQNELVKAKNMAEESSRLKSILLNNITHELRTPLNGIIGFSEMLRHELVDPNQAEMITGIHDSGIRLMNTLNSIMTLSQLVSGSRKPIMAKTDIHAEMNHILDLFRTEAEKKGISLLYSSHAELTGILDQSLFRHSIANIVDNAIKFTHTGKVEISSSLFMREETRFLSIEVTDTGIGISCAGIQIIFDEFRQVSEGNKRNYEGSGLGLTIALKMVELMKGTIDVASTPDVGSRFTVAIPFPEVS